MPMDCRAVRVATQYRRTRSYPSRGHSCRRRAGQWAAGFDYAGRIADRSQTRGLSQASRSKTPGVDFLSATNRAPSRAPRYRSAMAARTEPTSHSTNSLTPRTSMPRKGRTASKTTRTHRGSRARWRSLRSPLAITTSNRSSLQRNQTGETSALPSFRYVVKTAGRGTLQERAHAFDRIASHLTSQPCQVRRQMAPTTASQRNVREIIVSCISVITMLRPWRT